MMTMPVALGDLFEFTFAMLPFNLKYISLTIFYNVVQICLKILFTTTMVMIIAHSQIIFFVIINLN